MTTTSVQSRAARTGSWVRGAAAGAAAWLVFWTALSILGFWFVPGDTLSRDIAGDVANRGGTVDALAVEVHVSGTGAGSSVVDRVRVLTSEMDQWRELDALADADALPQDRDWPVGWQASTDATGYARPLPVLVTNDATGAVEHVVAQRDVEYWSQRRHDPQTWWAVGIGSLLIGVGGAAGWAVRSQRRRHR